MAKKKKNKKSKKKGNKKSGNKESKKSEGKFKRLGSGVKGFDNLIEGGYIEDSLNMIVGDAGSGKSIFSIQFLVDGLKNDEKCLFVTFEEDKEEFYDNMKEFGWDLEKYEKKNKLFFLEYSPKKVKTMIESGGGEIERIILKNKIDRLVIDSMSSFLLLFDDEVEKREAALSLFDIMKRWDVTSILTLQRDPKKEEISNLEFETDSVILLYFKRKKKKRKRFIEVLKMRGTEHSNEIHPVELGEKGFKVFKKSVKL